VPRAYVWTSKIAVIAVVFGAAIHVSSTAQEVQDGTRQGRPAQRPASSEPSPLQSPESVREFDEQAFRQSTAEGAPIEEASETIALTLWVLTVTAGTENSDDELSTNLADRIAKLPTAVGALNDVRKLVSQLKVAGVLNGMKEYRVTTIDGQPVSIQIGGNLPRIVATNVTPAGQTNTVQYEPVGTIVKLHPRLGSDSSLKVSVEYNASHLEKSSDVWIAQSANQERTFADVTTTHQLNTTVRLKSGTAVLVESDATDVPSPGAEGSQTKLIILGAQVIPSLE
jgi:hypothetical protein